MKVLETGQPLEGGAHPALLRARPLAQGRDGRPGDQGRPDQLATRPRDAYSQFLQALVGSEAGQDYESLMWAGESMLDLEHAAEGPRRVPRVLETYEKDPEFLEPPDAADRLLRARLKLVDALREPGQFARRPGRPSSSRRTPDCWSRGSRRA